MVSNPLSPNPSTVAAQAQYGFGRYGKLIVTGLINPEDYEVAEKKAEQLAPDSSPGLAHHPKMGAYSFTPISVFEPPSDIKPGPEGDPTGPIAVNNITPFFSGKRQIFLQDSITLFRRSIIVYNASVTEA